MLSQITQKNITSFAENCVAPVMLSYVSWVVSNAVKNGHKKIYFLARDGFVPVQIAKMICKQNDISIDCRYLYCSRFSLRLPMLSYCKDDEYNKYLFEKSTPEMIVKKVCPSEQQMKQILKDINVEKLTTENDESLFLKLKKSKVFSTIVKENSQIAFENIISYFKQEGLFDSDEVAIVDVGWLGTMQHCIFSLLKQAGFTGKIHGYYFGLYNKQKDDDGIYDTFYFDYHSHKKRKVLFNANLFECMFSANHGTTLGYEKKGEQVLPILKEEKNENTQELINRQINATLDYVKKQNLKLNNFVPQNAEENVYKTLKKYMVYPSRETCDIFSNYIFCDDANGEEISALSSPSLTKNLKANMLIPRIFNKLFHRKKYKPLLWAYGVIAYQPKILQPWYRFNIKLVNYISISRNKK